jgi:ketosteroid isomerase-like protein
MKNENTQTEIEAHIRKLIDNQIRAVRDKNIDQALNNYDKNVLSFDVVDPLQFIGIDAIRTRLEEWFATFQGPIENEISGLKIEISGEIAFCSRLNHVNAIKVDGGKLDMWWRETTCFKKMDGHWMITHVHSSVPFNTQNGKASTALKPSTTLEDIAITNKEEKKVLILIKNYFAAYESNDRKTIDELLGDDFRFSSPDDPDIDKVTYFKKCWPFSEKAKFYKIEKLIEDNDEGFVQYECDTITGNKFKNMEFFGTKANKIKKIEVYYGSPAK